MKFSVCMREGQERERKKDSLTTKNYLRASSKVKRLRKAGVEKNGLSTGGKKLD